MRLLMHAHIIVPKSTIAAWCHQCYYNAPSRWQVQWGARPKYTYTVYIMAVTPAACMQTQLLSLSMRISQDRIVCDT